MAAGNARKPWLDGTSLVVDLRLDDALVHSVTLRGFASS
jgi:hypothetical protein